MGFGVPSLGAIFASQLRFAGSRAGELVYRQNMGAPRGFRNLPNRSRIKYFVGFEQQFPGNCAAYSRQALQIGGAGWGQSRCGQDLGSGSRRFSIEKMNLPYSALVARRPSVPANRRAAELCRNFSGSMGSNEMTASAGSRLKPVETPVASMKGLFGNSSGVAGPNKG